MISLLLTVLMLVPSGFPLGSGSSSAAVVGPNWVESDLSLATTATFDDISSLPGLDLGFAAEFQAFGAITDTDNGIRVTTVPAGAPGAPNFVYQASGLVTPISGANWVYGFRFSASQRDSLASFTTFQVLAGYTDAIESDIHLRSFAGAGYYRASQTYEGHAEGMATMTSWVSIGGPTLYSYYNYGRANTIDVVLEYNSPTLVLYIAPAGQALVKAGSTAVAAPYDAGFIGLWIRSDNANNYITLHRAGSLAAVPN